MKCWAGWSSSWNQDWQENINNLRYKDDTTLTAESEEELKSVLMRVKEETEKTGLTLSIQNTKITASGPSTSWQIEGGRVEAVTDFILLGSKVTVDSDGSHEMKRCLLLGRKAKANLACMHACPCSVAQSCLTLRDPMDCRPPGSSVHGIFQARILEWVAISSSKGSSWLGDRTHISCIDRQILYHWATWEAWIRRTNSRQIRMRFS